MKQGSSSKKPQRQPQRSPVKRRQQQEEESDHTVTESELSQEEEPYAMTENAHVVSSDGSEMCYKGGYNNDFHT